MYKIAVIGGPDTVIGFKALGLDTFPVRTGEEARHIFRAITKPDQPDEYAIIYLEENLAEALKADIDRFVGEAEQFDDITMLALEYREKMKETGEE